MEVVFELLFEVVGQLLIELVLNLGFRRVGKLLSNRFVRVFLGIGLGGAVAYGGGWWWGDRLSEVGRTAAPSSLYVSIGLAVAFGALALLRALKGPRDDSFPSASATSSRSRASRCSCCHRCTGQPGACWRSH